MHYINAKHVGYGQCLSLLIAGTSIFSKLLETNGVSLPAFQSFLSYGSVALIFSALRYWHKKRDFFSLRIPIWIYIIMAVVDIQANCLVLTSFRYANFATVALLLHLTIPFVTLMSVYLLRVRYSWSHLVGALVSLSGSVIIFVSDYSALNGKTTSSEVYGNSLCVMAAFLYAISNVVQEWSVSSYKNAEDDDEMSLEFLSTMGSFATIFAASQAVMLELDTEVSNLLDYKILCYLGGYVLFITAFYGSVSHFLRVAEALLFNLSLLTADAFIVLASYLIFNEPVNNVYWIAFVLNFIGITIYSWKQPAINEEIETPEKEIKLRDKNAIP